MARRAEGAHDRATFNASDDALVDLAAEARLPIYPLAMFWPSGWAWHSGSPFANDYYGMIVGVYAVLGVFLILAARD